MESTIANRQPFRLDPPFLGIGLLISWSTAFVRSKGMGISATQTDMHTLFYTFSAASLACLLLHFFMQRRNPRAPESPNRQPAVPIVCAALMTLATIANARLFLFVGIEASTLSIAAAIMGSFGYAILLVRWGPSTPRLKTPKGF